MKITIERLDGRHKGSGHWTHRAIFSRNYSAGFSAKAEVTKGFIDTRNQLWENFGPGCDRQELYSVANATNHVPEWGWWTDTQADVPYIYFTQGPILTWFLMRV